MQSQISFSQRVSYWIQAVRPFAFTASIIPITLGAVCAFSGPQPVRWELFPLILLCSLLFHSGTNLINDYYDFKHGLDTPTTFGSSGILPQGKLPPRQIYRGALLCFAAGFLLGCILVSARGIPMLVLGTIGLLGGFFYTAHPVEYKYRALGDMVVFILMGPLMVIGSYFALTGGYHPRILSLSLPIGFLVAGILHANNLRDIDHDKQSHIKTIANILGHRRAQIQYVFLIGCAYVSILLLMTTGTLSAWGFLVFLSLPVALKNIGTIKTSNAHAPHQLATIDIETAKLHFLFGILMVTSLSLDTIPI